MWNQRALGENAFSIIAGCAGLAKQPSISEILFLHLYKGIISYLKFSEKSKSVYARGPSIVLITE